MKGLILGGLGMVAGWQLSDLFYHSVIDGVMVTVFSVGCLFILAHLDRTWP